MNRPEEITITGAGLVGSLLAVRLGNLGYRVVVFEKRADLRQGSVASGRSINLALAERGIRALETARLMPDVRSLLIPMPGRLLHGMDNKLEFMPYGQRPTEVIHSVSRAGLNALMLTAAESTCQVELQFEKSLESIDFKRKSITLTDLSTGRKFEHNYQILIGADGAGSRVRRALLPAAHGIDRSELLDHDYKELTIPAGNDGRHQIEREALHIWPRGGYMLIALPNLDGSFTVTLFLQKTGEPGFAQLSDQQSVNDFFRTQFPDAFQLIPNLAHEFFKNPTGILGTVRCSPWIFNDSVMLIGDAAHAIVPFHGQGMNAGFEDCELFVDLLDTYNHDWPTAMQEFDGTRRENTDAIAVMALENYVTMRDSVRDQNFQLKKELGFELERRFPDRFIPRYSMVMFHSLPYSTAFLRGKIQQTILDQLTATGSKLADIDFDAAGEQITKLLPPV